MSKAYIVPSFHHDIAYLRTESYYNQRAMDIIDQFLDIAEQHAEYRFFIEQAYLLEEYMDRRPQNARRLAAAIRRGQCAVDPGFYAVPDMNLAPGESMYMQASVGRMVLDKLGGKPSRVAMITDCWGHPAYLPQVMTQCGYAYYCYSRCMRGDVNVQNYRWQGPDGSVLRTHWMSTHYEGIAFPSKMAVENAEEMNWAEGVDGIKDLMARNRMTCGDDPQYLPSGGDVRFPSPAAPDIVRSLNQRGDLPELVFATPEEALSAIDWDSKPIAEGDFVSLYQGTFTTNIFVKQSDKRTERDITSLEALYAILGRDADFLPMWKLHLKNEFHDIICGTICSDARRDVMADYHALDCLIADKRRATDDCFRAPALFNPLPFARTETVDGRRYALPALGFAKLDEGAVPEEADLPALPLTFENTFYCAQTDALGNIVSLRSKMTGKEIVDTSKGIPFGSLVMQTDNGDCWWAFRGADVPAGQEAWCHNRPDGYRSDLTRNLPSRIESAEILSADGDAVVIRQHGVVRFWVMQIEYTVDTTFRKSSPRIEFHLSYVNRTKDYRLRAAFPVNCAEHVVHQIPFCTMERGAGEQAVEMFMQAHDGETALTLINRGIPANNTEEGIMLLTLYRSVAMEYKCESSASYGLGETCSFDYAIVPHAADDQETAWQQALAFTTPPVRTALPDAALPFGLSNAYLSALRRTENGLFVRLYNPYDAEKKVSLSIGQPYSAYCTADGLMKPTGEWTVMDDGKLDLTLPPYRIENLLFK